MCFLVYLYCVNSSAFSASNVSDSENLESTHCSEYETSNIEESEQGGMYSDTDGMSMNSHDPSSMSSWSTNQSFQNLAASLDKNWNKVKLILKDLK